MRLLVIGGTGREIVRQAITAGHPVAGLVRDLEVAAVSLPGAHLVAGDVPDAAGLDRARDGREAVASTLGGGLSPFSRMTMLPEGTKTLVGAMTGRGVRELVCITGVGAGDGRGHGGFVSDWLIQPTSCGRSTPTRIDREPSSGRADCRRRDPG